MELIAFVGVCLLAGLWCLALLDRARERPCPYCMKRVHKHATRCPHCRSDLEPAPLSGIDADIAARRAADDAARAGGPPPLPTAEQERRDGWKLIG